MMGQLLPAAKQVQGARPRADGDACTRRLANPSQAQRRSPGSERRRAWRRGFPRSEETEHQSRGSAASGFGLKFCGSLKALAALTQRELEDASGWWLCWGPRGEARGPRRPSAWTICREKVCVAGKSRGRGRERRPYRVRAAGGSERLPLPRGWGGSQLGRRARVKLGSGRAGLGSGELHKGRGASARRRPVLTPTFPRSAPVVQAQHRCLGYAAGEAGRALAPRCRWSGLRLGSPPSHARKAAQVLLLGTNGLF